MFVIPSIDRLGRRFLRKNGFTTRTLRAPDSAGGGAVFAFDAQGEGELPTHVVLHGLSSASTAFTAVMMRLKKQARRVVAIDFPGHGFSDEPIDTFTPQQLYDTTSKVLGELVPEPSVVIGNSLGGGVALQYAVRHPERVLALVLLSPAGSRATESEWARIRGIFAIENRRDAMAFMRTVYHRFPTALHLIAHELPQAVGKRSVQDLMRTASNDDAPTETELASLKMPILFLWGASERLFSDQQLDYFRANLPKHAIIERPEGVGHCPHFDDPAGIARRIVEFSKAV